MASEPEPLNPLEGLLRPVAGLLNRNIDAMTPARELADKLDGKVVAVQVRDTTLAVYFRIDAGEVALKTRYDDEPDVTITGTLLTLAGLAAAGEDALEQGGLDLSGDLRTARDFQRLLGFAKPDVEEELSRVVGDPLAHQLGRAARGFEDWLREARSTMGENLREYLQEESGQAPTRYEVERFARGVATLRDDVARLEARLKRLADRS